MPPQDFGAAVRDDVDAPPRAVEQTRLFHVGDRPAGPVVEEWLLAAGHELAQVLVGQLEVRCHEAADLPHRSLSSIAQGEQDGLHQGLVVGDRHAALRGKVCKGRFIL